MALKAANANAKQIQFQSVPLSTSVKPSKEHLNTGVGSMNIMLYYTMLAICIIILTTIEMFRVSI